MAKALNVLFMMTKEKILALWEHHSNVPENSAAMLPMHGADDFWSVQVRPLVDVGTVDTLGSYTKFSDIDIDKLVHLRRLIVHGLENEQVAVWMEKILRYTEINLRSLDEKLAGSKNKNTFCWQLLSLLVDHYFIAMDIRFLNAAMKLYDRKWMKAEKLLTANAGNDICQALAVRGHMLIEYTIHKLRND